MISGPAQRSGSCSGEPSALPGARHRQRRSCRRTCRRLPGESGPANGCGQRLCRSMKKRSACTMDNASAGRRSASSPNACSCRDCNAGRRQRPPGASRSRRSPASERREGETTVHNSFNCGPVRLPSIAQSLLNDLASMDRPSIQTCAKALRTPFRYQNKPETTRFSDMATFFTATRSDSDTIFGWQATLKSHSSTSVARMTSLPVPPLS